MISSRRCPSRVKNIEIQIRIEKDVRELEEQVDIEKKVNLKLKETFDHLYTLSEQIGQIASEQKNGNKEIHKARCG